MGAIVYLLCFLTSFACAAFLFKGYRGSKSKLLFWSCFGFLGFAVNNAILMIDMIIIPEFDLSVFRTLPTAIGMTLLAYGLISEST